MEKNGELSWHLLVTYQYSVEYATLVVKEALRCGVEVLVDCAFLFNQKVSKILGGRRSWLTLVRGGRYFLENFLEVVESAVNVNLNFPRATICGIVQFNEMQIILGNVILRELNLSTYRNFNGLVQK